MALSAPGASGGGGAGLRPAGADAGQGRSVSVQPPEQGPVDGAGGEGEIRPN